MENTNGNSMKNKEEIISKKIIIFLSFILVVYILITKLNYPPEPFLDRGTYLIISFLILFCLQFPKYRGIRRILLVLGVIFAVIGCAHVIISADRINANFVIANEKTDFYFFVIYFIGVAILLHDSLGGRIITMLGVIATAYLFLGEYVPGIFSFPAFSLKKIASMLYINYEDGAFGSLLSITSRILSVFLLFSSLLVATGLGDLIRALSTLLAGKSKGGPAKVAVIGSALFGMLSGSAVSNVAATGSFTIPLMKRIGYKPSTAAAIETIASTGGSLAPPIMGLSAFVMSDMIGVPYVKIITWAIIPAFLWYYTTYLYVHFSAHAQDIQLWKPARKELLDTIKKTGHLGIAVIVLVYFIIFLRVAELAAFYSIISLFIISFFRKRTLLNWEKMKGFLLDFAKVFCGLCVLNTMLGIFVGALIGTGTHSKFIYLVLGGITNWVVILIIFFLICLLFGMLVPPFIAYVTVVLAAGPVLHQLGFSIPVIHMFILYGCTLAPITPPVAIAAYTAASIAGAGPIEVAKEASTKALSLWLIPFIVFRYKLHIGLNTSLSSIVMWVVIIAIGIFVFTLATNRYFLEKISSRWATSLLVISIMILQPVNMWISIIGSLLGIGAIIILLYLFKKNVPVVI